MRTDELGNTYTMMGEKLPKRFEIKEDPEPLGDLKYSIYDNETLIIVSYITDDELETGLDVVKYLNSLDSDIKCYMRELKSLQDYYGVSKSELVEMNKEAESRIRYAEGLHNLEIKHIQEVLNTCIAAYPKSKSLLDFKSSLGW